MKFLLDKLGAKSGRRGWILMDLKVSLGLFFVGVFLVIFFSFYAEAEKIEALGGDKLWHVLAFGFLGLMGAIAFPKGHRLFMIIAGLVIFGLAIEIVQFITPSRSAHLGDIIANLVGLSCGIAAAVSANLLGIRRIGGAS